MFHSKECMCQNNLYHIEEELLTAAAENYCEFEIIYEYERKKYILRYSMYNRGIFALFSLHCNQTMLIK